MDASKQVIIDNLRRFINTRPGIDAYDYCLGRQDTYGILAYRKAVRQVTADKHDALRLLAEVEARDSITAEDIISASNTTYSGRLEISANGTVSYTTGQYFPTEYRKAVAAVCADAIWKHTIKCLRYASAQTIREYMRHRYGRRIALRYFC